MRGFFAPSIIFIEIIISLLCSKIHRGRRSAYSLYTAKYSWRIFIFDYSLQAYSLYMINTFDVFGDDFMYKE
jgi:hypothetical protein